MQWDIAARNVFLEMIIRPFAVTVSQLGLHGTTRARIMKSDVSGTNLIPAKRKTWFGWPSWPSWRTKRLASQITQMKGSAFPVQRPLVLIGAFDDLAALGNALMQFSAAAFTSSDMICVAADRPADVTGIWWKLRRRIGLGRDLGPVVPDEPGLADYGVEAERVLASGGGLVLVRSAPRFQQACEIIERAGGRIGVPLAA